MGVIAEPVAGVAAPEGTVFSIGGDGKVSKNVRLQKKESVALQRGKSSTAVRYALQNDMREILVRRIGLKAHNLLKLDPSLYSIEDQLAQTL